MSTDVTPPTLDEQAEKHKRKVGQAVKFMTIAWPLAVILGVYLRFFAEKGAGITHVVSIITVICLLAAFGATYQFFESRKEYRFLTGRGKDRE